MGEIGTTSLGLSGLSDDEDIVLDLGDNLEVETISEENKEEKNVNDLIVEQKDDTLDKKENNNTGDSEIIGLKKESVAGKEGQSPGKKENDVVTSPSDEEKTSQIYSSFAQHFQETGVLPNLDLEKTPVKNAEDLAEAVRSQIEYGLDVQQKAYYDAMKSGIQRDDYIRYKEQMHQLNGITDEILNSEENQNLRLELIARDFMTKGFDQEKAFVHAQRSLKSGDDINDAKEALGSLKNYVQTSYDNKKDIAAKKDKKDLEDIKNYIDNKNEFIQGIKLNDSTKSRLYKQITTPVATNNNGKPVNAYTKAFLENPVKMRVATEYMFYITKGFTDFSKISEGVETKTSKNLDELLKHNGAGFLENGKVNFENQDKNSQFNLDGFEIDV